MYTANYQLQLLLNGLASPMGLLGIITILFLLVLTFWIPPMKWIMLAASLFCSTLIVAELTERQPLMFPLEQLSRQGRPLTIAFMVIAMIGALLVPGGRRRKPFSIAFLMFFLFQMVIGVNQLLRGDFSHGAGSIVLFMLQFFVFGLAIPNALQTDENVISYTRGVAGFGVLFAAINFIQLMVNPHAVIATRFTGTTANQQGTGIFSAMGLVPVCYLLVRSGRERLGRITYGAAAAMLIIMTLWSGSRTGVLVAIVGLAVLFRTRLSRLAAAAVVIVLFIVLTSMLILPAAEFISPHLFSTTDTRSDVWRHQIESFTASPLLGHLSAEQSGYGENSYLAVAASYGLVGLIPLALALLFIAAALRKLMHYRPLFHDRLLADLVLAAFAQWAIGGIFEAYFLGILNCGQILNFCFYPILAYLLEQAETAPAMLDGSAFATPEEYFENAHVPAGFG